MVPSNSKWSLHSSWRAPHNTTAATYLNVVVPLAAPNISLMVSGTLGSSAAGDAESTGDVTRAMLQAFVFTLYDWRGPEATLSRRLLLGRLRISSAKTLQPGVGRL